MSLITGNIKSLLTIKPKARHDNYTDQYHRIFMVKMSMVASLLLGLNWLKDTITCIVPGSAGMDGSFVKQACWIQGFYVYKDIKNIPGNFRYYGIPKNLDEDGMYDNGELCTVDSSNPTCGAMTKTFYLQYQWFPFYMGVIGLLYYLPYVFFRYINTDLIGLKTNVKAVAVDIDGLVNNYFNYSINPKIRMSIRVVGNIFIKIFYILVNIIAFIGTDTVLNGDFRMYGNEWLKWTKESNQVEYDYTASRSLFKPGEVLLPTFGLCEVLELGKDIKHTLFNKHRFVCEISQNVLYQYVLILLWFLFIIGIVISVVGLLIEVGDHILAKTSCMVKGDQTKKVYDALTIRECQYLEYLRKKDMTIYGKVIRKLNDTRLHMDSNGYEPDPNNPYGESQKMLKELGDA